MSTHEPHVLTPAETVEEACHLLDAGTPPREVARRLGLSLAALEQRLRRSGATTASNQCSVARRWDR